MIERPPRLLRITTVPVSLKLLLEGQFNFFQQQGFEVLTVSADGPEVQELIALGVNHQIVNMTRAITPIRDLLAFVRLIRIIKKFKPDIVHTHTPKAGLLGMMAAWICKVHVRMHTVAGLPLMEATGFKKWILKMTERITYACAHRIYPNSVGLRDYIKSQIANHKSQITIIGKGSSNGIDTNFFSANDELKQKAHAIRKMYAIPEDSVVFSFVGRVVKDKGIVELVEAFQKIGKVRNAWLFLIGPFEEDLDPLPNEVMDILKNENRIILAGFQKDVRSWMLTSDVFVFPSYREGFPNVVMQAACLGIPCIATDINGCNELIQNGKTGLLIPAKNSEQLFEAMKVMISDKTLALEMARQANEFVKTNFSREMIWRELLKEYQFFLRN